MAAKTRRVKKKVRGAAKKSAKKKPAGRTAKKAAQKASKRGSPRGRARRRVLALNCCSRRDRGGTLEILESFLRGMHDEGAEVELVDVARLDIAPLEGTLDGIVRPSSRRQDDMDGLLGKLRTADVWVFATQVLSGGPSGHMQKLLDRMIALLDIGSSGVGAAEMPLKPGVLKGSVALVAGCPGWDADEMDVTVELVQRFSKKMSRRFEGALLRPHSLALPHLMWLGRDTEHVLTAAHQAGGALATEGKLPSRALAGVGAELMSKRLYTRHLQQVVREGQAAVEAEGREPQDDSLKVKTTSQPFDFGEHSDHTVQRAVLDAVVAMGGTGPRAEENYRARLEVLRVRCADALGAIEHALRALPKEQYLDRWSLIHLLGELGDPGCLRVLDDVLNEPLGPERSKSPCQGSTRGEEVILKTSAIESIKRVGGDESCELLLKHVRHEIFSVRRAAVQSYLEVGGKGARARLRRVLPEAEHHLLEIERRGVREIPQAVNFDRTSELKDRDEPTPLRPLDEETQDRGQRAGDDADHEDTPRV